MPIRAILFDLDNTLILEDAATFAAVRRASEHAGGDTETIAAAAATAADELFRASSVFPYAHQMGIWWGEALWGDFAGDAPGLRALRAFVPEFRKAVWARAAAGDVTGAARPGDLDSAFVRARRSDWMVDPAARPTLDDLAPRYRLAVVTNGAPDVQREKLVGSGLGAAFATVIISAELGIGKPDRRIFDAAVDAIGVAAGDAVMVGDSVERDVEGARAAGLLTIWLDRDDKRSPATADARIASLGELPAALAAMNELVSTARSG